MKLAIGEAVVSRETYERLRQAEFSGETRNVFPSADSRGPFLTWEYTRRKVDGGLPVLVIRAQRLEGK